MNPSACKDYEQIGRRMCRAAETVCRETALIYLFAYEILFFGEEAVSLQPNIKNSDGERTNCCRCRDIFKTINRNLWKK